VTPAGNGGILSVKSVFVIVVAAKKYSGTGFEQFNSRRFRYASSRLCPKVVRSDSEAPGGWRTPKRFALPTVVRIAARFWTVAAAPCRFSNLRFSAVKFRIEILFAGRHPAR
jgi:hypothetical protein